MSTFVEAHLVTVASCFAGWLVVILYACQAAAIRRRERGEVKPRVPPWRFLAERPLRCSATALFAAFGYLGLVEFDLLSPFWAFVAGVSCEATAELVRGFAKGGFLRQLLEQRMGIKVPIPDDEGPRLGDTTIIRPQRKDENR